jgi:hypothetical protein
MRLTEKLNIRLDREFRHLEKRSPIPLESFWYKLYYATRILDITEKYSEKETESRNDKLTIKKEARKNFIINCITATEVYFKDLVKTLPEVNIKIKNGQGIKDLLIKKDKINLWEAYKIFNETGVRLGDILIYYYSFQSLREIDNVMSQLLNIKFLDSIDEHKSKVDKEDKDFFNLEEIVLKNNYPEWRKYLKEIFELRHDFVHHINYRDKLGYNKVVKLFYNLCAFIIVTDDFIFEKYVPD